MLLHRILIYFVSHRAAFGFRLAIKHFRVILFWVYKMKLNTPNAFKDLFEKYDRVLLESYLLSQR